MIYNIDLWFQIKDSKDFEILHCQQGFSASGFEIVVLKLLWHLIIEHPLIKHFNQFHSDIA
jgi:hypothetical protein